MGRPINPSRKSNIRVKINKAGYKKLIQLGNTVHAALAGNLNFATPIPTLPDLATAVTVLTTATIQMGQKRSRGSKSDLAIAQSAAIDLRNILTALKQYVITTAVVAAPTDIPNQTAILATSGFGFAVTRALTPKSQIPTFVRQTNNHKFPGTVGRINWKRPIGLIKGKRVSSFDIYQIDPITRTRISFLGTTTKTNFESAVPVGTSIMVAIVPKNSRGEGNVATVQIKGML